MAELFSPTLDDQIAEIEREIAMRRRVFPELVSRGRLSERKAAFRIVCLEETLKFLRRLKEKP